MKGFKSNQILMNPVRIKLKQYAMKLTGNLFIASSKKLCQTHKDSQNLQCIHQLVFLIISHLLSLNNRFLHKTEKTWENIRINIFKF